MERYLNGQATCGSHHVIMKQFLIVMIASGLNARMILIRNGENVIVWWKICMYFGGNTFWEVYMYQSIYIHPETIFNTHNAFLNECQLDSFSESHSWSLMSTNQT